MSARIALVYVEAGFGPKVMARRLEASLAKAGHASCVISLRQLIPPWLHALLLDQYRNECLQQSDSLSRWHLQPWRFAWLYRALGLLHRPTPAARHSLSRVRVAMATSYLAAFFLIDLRRRLGLQFKVVGLLGDYCTSAGWRLPVDALVTPRLVSNATLDWLQARNIALLPLGIPLDEHEYHPPPEAGHLLVTGGGWGLGGAYDCLEHALQHCAVRRVIALCGDNPSLLEHLGQRHACSIKAGRLLLLPSQPNLGPLYARSWAVLSKPGGLTLSEAAQHGCPLLLAKPITEHERRNAVHFLAHGAALDATSPQKLAEALSSLAHKRTQLSDSARSLIEADATRTITSNLLTLEQAFNVDD